MTIVQDSSGKPLLCLLCKKRPRHILLPCSNFKDAFLERSMNGWTVCRRGRRGKLGHIALKKTEGRQFVSWTLLCTWTNWWSKSRTNQLTKGENTCVSISTDYRSKYRLRLHSSTIHAYSGMYHAWIARNAASYAIPRKRSRSSPFLLLDQDLCGLSNVAKCDNDTKPGMSSPSWMISEPIPLWNLGQRNNS